MNFHVDNTPLVSPPIRWVNVPLFMSERQESRLPSEWTVFSTAKAALIDFFDPEIGPNTPTAAPSAQVRTESTQTLSDLSGRPANTHLAVPSNTSIELIAKQRVQLMAAKYASDTVPSEIVARLEILNHRLLALAPRVSEDQVLALENANEQLVHIRAAREERSKRLGIPV